MMKNILTLLIPFFIINLSTQPAFAGDAMDTNRVAFRGFGTLGVSCFTANSYDFIGDESRLGPGQSRRCDTQLDSLLGLQLDANLSEQIAGTLQAVSYHRADNTFTPGLTLANLRFEFSNAYTLRVGRIQNPEFLVSEYRTVHIAQPWVRPPVDFYFGQSYNKDGVEITHRQELNGDALTIQGVLDVSTYQVGDGSGNTYPAIQKNVYVDVEFEHEYWHLKGGLLEGRISLSIPGIDSALSSLDLLGAPELASSLSMQDKRISTISLGGSYENNLWQVQAEYYFRKIDSYVRDQNAAYLMAGRRLGDWMPYGIISKRWSRSQGKENQATDSTQYSIAKALVDSTDRDIRSLAAGLSLKLSENATLKGQLDFVKPDTSSSLPTNIERLTTLNLDFIF